MEARRLRLMLLLLAVSLIGSAAFTWLIDPCGRGAHPLIARSYRSDETTVCAVRRRERTAIPYRLREERPTQVLVGSSRVQYGMPVDPDAGDGFLNAALRGASVPELAAVLDVAAGNPDLRRVVWAVDFFAFGADYAAFQDVDLPRRLRGETRWQDAAVVLRRDVWDLDALVESWRVLGRVLLRRERQAPLHPVPWPPAVLARRLGDRDGLVAYDDAWTTQSIRSAFETYRHHRPSAAAGALLAATTDRLRARGVDVDVVILPMSACELQVIRSLGLWDAFVQWKRTVLEAVGPYWDFSGDPETAGDETLFMDVMHAKSPTGQTILRHLLGAPCDDCGARAARLIAGGVRVDADTIDAHLAAQRAERFPLRGRCATSVPETVAMLSSDGS